MYERVRQAGVKLGVAECVNFVRLSRLSDIRKELPLLLSQEDSSKGKNSQSCTSRNQNVDVIGDRQLCVLVLATVGRSIGKPTTIYELVSATRTAVIGHKEIYQKAGILHRDISTSNVRIRDPRKEFEDGIDEDQIEVQSYSADEGFLIDFDLSLIQEDSPENRSERLARTGTFAFMAWQIMYVDSTSIEEDEGSPESSLHNYKHDLQSFFWVLLYICAGSPVFTQEPLDQHHPSFNVMRIFSEASEDSAQLLKEKFLRDSRRQLWVAPPFQSMYGVLTKIRALLFPKKWESLTHDAFISVLDEALRDPAIQARTVIKHHRYEPHYLEPRYQKPVTTKDSSVRIPGSRGNPSRSSTLPKADRFNSRMPQNSHSQALGHPGPQPVGDNGSSSTVGSGLNQQLRGSSSRKRAADPSLPSRDSKRSRTEGNTRNQTN
ncbi:hypothetical protein FRC02_006162 [Tulasnella sp. 418]|nr:hypothetical protein FRC02_006162 [Tulasnella sp. 418]